MGSRDLCLKLIEAESEDEAIKILKDAGHWDDESAWRDYGDDPGNISTITNQQSDPIAAIVEKIVNSVDAVLMKECQLRGINPKDSRAAPRSMKEATEMFFGVSRGAISNLTMNRRKKLAESIRLVATGDSMNPCYIIIDDGEGQTPEKFPETLVSLHSQNKVEVHFVQGVYNMGSTGVLRFCGENGLQLIVSRRNPRIAAMEEDDSSAAQWGFTVVRKFPPTGNMKSSVYRYLAPLPGNGVLRFDGSPLKVIPGPYPVAYGEELESGTIIKLYDYKVRGRPRSNILMHFFFRLSLHLAELALPIMVHERRSGYGGSGHHKIMTGLTVRLHDDPRGTLEPGFPSSGTLSVSGKSIGYTVYAFKKNKSESYIQNESVIFIVNGQTHDIRTRDFLRRTSVGLSYLADSILVVIDCSDLPRRITEFLFMASRDRSSRNEEMEEIEEQLMDILANHQGLKELKERRRREEAKKQLSDPKPMHEVLKKAVERLPTIAHLFRPNSRSGNPFKIAGVSEQLEPYMGKRFPTYFTLISEKKRIVTSKRFHMKYETDAENGFFRRDDTPGKYSLALNGEEAKSSSHHMGLWNGMATLTITLPESATDGNRLHYLSRVWEEGREDNPFEENFTIIVGKLKETAQGGMSSRRHPPSDLKGTKRNRDSGFLPPQVIDVYREDWDTHGFDKFTALVVKHVTGKIYDYYVNMNNFYLEREMKLRSDLTPEILRAQFR
ncbi:MAG: hypothetical protein ACFFER_20090, partial [Candidatus Thorarchaeota archaeon]